VIGRLRAFLHSDAQVHRLIRDTSWLSGSRALALLLVFPQGLLVARGLGVERYGRFVLITTFVMFADMLTAFRMNEFVVRYVAQALSDGDRRTAAASLKAAMLAEAVSALTAFGFVVLAAPLGARLFLKTSSAAGMIRLFAFVILCNLVAESTLGLLQAVGRFRQQALLETFGQGLRTVGLVVVFAASGGLQAYLLVWLGAQLAQSGAYVVAALTAAHREMGPRWWAVPLRHLKGRFRPMLRFGVHTNLSGTLKVINRTVDPLILGFFRTPAEAGYYKLALSLIDASFVPVGPLTDVFFPELARASARARWDDMKRLWRRGSLFMTAWTVPVLTVLLLGAPWAIPFVVGDRYAPVVPVLVVLAPGIAYANIRFWARPSLLALGLADYATKVNAAVTAVKLGASALVVPFLGPIGSAAILSADLGANIGLQVRKARATVDGHVRVAADAAPSPSHD
jgi:O-antigen/teichoic acid export membrane protein